MERLTLKGYQYDKSNFMGYGISEMANKLREYEDAEEQGRLVKLPCKEGDEVFVLRDSIRGKTVLSGKVQKIEIAHGNILVTTTLGMFNALEFGKSVFLSEEELAEMQKGN